MRVCGRQCTISETEPTGAWETSLRRYKAVPSHGNPGPRGQVTLYNKRKSRESPNRSNVPEWDSEVFMSELVKSESRSTAVPSSSKSVESNPVTPSLVSKAVSTMAPSSNSISQDPEKVVDLTELELRIEGALKRCSIFSQSFTYPGPEEVVLSGTFLSMRSGVACLKNGNQPVTKKGTVVPSVRNDASISGEVKRKATEIGDAVDAMRQQMVDLNQGFIHSDVLERACSAAPEIIPFVTGVKQLMREIDAVDRGTLTCRQLLQSGIRKKQQELQQLLH
uniref:Uncharacterized protein n=1 Tax=Tetraselmis chuii TaxID=63592 RepID=A0A7S1T851_9CHLO|mmetsp:Transcript_8495/g.15342  ORF Transcript_8495/g.15342 Transcript_8495/m.15342 type:complete len:279 (+) Transcript_8495:152-988(+)